MASDVTRDQLALIRIEGMHCHRCEQAIQKALSRHQGVHEVEVDFNSGQASVLYDRGSVSMEDLTNSVREAGYRVTGFAQREIDHAASSSSSAGAGDGGGAPGGARPG